MNFGLSIENVLVPFLFIILPLIPLIIPVGYLFGVLIAFGRLNSDGEFTALLANGYSMYRASIPVLLIAVVLYLCGTFCNMYLDPWGRQILVNFYQTKAQSELDSMIKTRIQPGIFVDDFLGFVLYAEKVSEDRTELENVMLSPVSGKGVESYVLLAPRGTIQGSVDTEELKMFFDFGMIYSATALTNNLSIVKFNRLEIDLLSIFEKQVLGKSYKDDDYYNYSYSKLWSYVTDIKKQIPSKSKKITEAYYSARYLLHQRVAMSFSVIIFAIFAMVFAIQDLRRGKNMAYFGVFSVILIWYVFMMIFKWCAEHNHLSAPLCAWLPQFIMLAFAWFLLYQKNRLPPSEPILVLRNIRNIPLFRKYKRA